MDPLTAFFCLQTPSTVHPSKAAVINPANVGAIEEDDADGVFEHLGKSSKGVLERELGLQERSQ